MIKIAGKPDLQQENSIGLDTKRHTKDNLASPQRLHKEIKFDKRLSSVSYTVCATRTQWNIKADTY